MSSGPLTQLVCGNCGEPLADGSACSNCGRRTIEVGLQAATAPKVWMGAKHKRPGVRGYLTEIKMGWEPMKALGGAMVGYVQKHWRKDRPADRYQEKVVAEDGSVLRDVDEPLSQHQGHGSAKLKKPDIDPPRN